MLAKPSKFYFTVESTGTLRAEKIITMGARVHIFSAQFFTLSTAVSGLRKKLASLLHQLKEEIAEQARSINQ